MEDKKIIRVADYLPKPGGDYNGCDFALPVTGNLLLALFGDMPDYSNLKFEELWQEIHNAGAESVIC